MAKLSDLQVAEMREAYAEGDRSKASLARQYGVTASHVARILSEESRTNPAHARYRIIQEAIAVTHETKRTPRQLADERAELIAFLWAAVPLLNGSFNQEERQAFIPEIEQLLTRLNS